MAPWPLSCLRERSRWEVWRCHSCLAQAALCKQSWWSHGVRLTIHKSNNSLALSLLVSCGCSKEHPEPVYVHIYGDTHRYTHVGMHTRTHTHTRCCHSSPTGTCAKGKGTEVQDVETAQTVRSCSPATTIQLLLVLSLGGWTELMFRGTCVFWSGFPSLGSFCFSLLSGGPADMLLPSVIPAC